MSLPLIPIWKHAPFLRLLPPFITGILLQWYVILHPVLIIILLLVPTLFLSGFQAVTLHSRFKLQWLSAAAGTLLLIACGCCITYSNHPQNKNGWLPSIYTGKGQITAVLQEPPTKKNQSFKALAAARRLYVDDRFMHVVGNVILYFKELPPQLSYGSTIIINKPLTPVKNSGNPGAFDYKRYCLFGHTAYQIYLTAGEFTILSRSETRGIQKLVFRCRRLVLNILNTYIRPAEKALAEALLIGYKDELDKTLAQAYANTGVIHVIAVSGMHLGLIYFLLAGFIKPLTQRHARWLGVILTLAGLWMFSLMAGAGPSVTRSAVMFSFIVVGNAFSKRNTIYNNLAASAFLLLCWNPFWLWDIGFQLSYAAVLSIVVFFRPVYNLIYVPNKLLDALWKLNAVTLSAQLLTTPLSIYHFHQFPTYFLPANMIAVPLSSALLLGELLLCMISFLPLPASWTGDVLSYLIKTMNRFIEVTNRLPFASWTHLNLIVLQVIALYGFIAATAYWLMYRKKAACKAAVLLFGVFACLRTHSFISATENRKIIIYNVPRATAIDFMNGRSYYYFGDAQIQKDPAIRNFHLEPGRILHRTSEAAWTYASTNAATMISFYGKRLLLLNKPLFNGSHLAADVLLLHRNPSVSIPRLLQSIRAKQVVADGSNTFYNIRQWQQDCQALGIPFHSVAENGAFILMCD